MCAWVLLRENEAIRQFAVMNDRPAARLPANDWAVNSHVVEPVVQGLKIPQGKRGFAPLVKSQPNARVAVRRLLQEGFVDRHVPRTGRGRVREQAARE
jgi:hypothetical protein